MDTIKKILSHIIFTTGAALVVLALFSLIFKFEIHQFTPTVLQVFATNILICFGLYIRWKFEIRYIIFEYLIDISYVIIVLIASWIIFDWYSVSVWQLVIMAFLIYILAVIISVNKIRKDTKEINELLQKHKEKEVDNAS